MPFVFDEYTPVSQSTAFINRRGPDGSDATSEHSETLKTGSDREKLKNTRLEWGPERARDQIADWGGHKFLAEGREISFVYFSDIFLKTAVNFSKFLFTGRAARMETCYMYSPCGEALERFSELDTCLVTYAGRAVRVVGHGAVSHSVADRPTQHTHAQKVSMALAPARPLNAPTPHHRHARAPPNLCCSGINGIEQQPQHVRRDGSSR